MNNTELQAIRRHLFFSVSEAAKYISHTSERAWRNWEHGVAPVPADVAETLDGLCDWRGDMIDNMERFLADAIERNRFVGTGILWYASADDYASLPDRDPILWRPHCSVVAELAAAYDVTLVAFDAAEYQAWLTDHGWKDSEEMRGQWAGSQLTAAAPE